MSGCDLCDAKATHQTPIEAPFGSELEDCMTLCQGCLDVWAFHIPRQLMRKMVYAANREVIYRLPPSRRLQFIDDIIISQQRLGMR